MSVSERQFKLSLNRELIDKNASADARSFVEGWENVEPTSHELREFIRSGVAYCAQLSGKRKAANFLASDIASVDVDHGTTVQEALTNPLVRAHALLVYTTASHTEERPRLRIVYALPRTVTDADEMAAILRSLALRRNGDRAATDATRISFGSTGAEVHMIGKSMSEDLMLELIDQSANLPVADCVTNGSSTANSRSRLTLSPSMLVRLARGGQARLSDAAPGAAVFCPVHADAHASAFIVRSRKGGTGLHCSTCSATYWTAVVDDFDFDNFTRTVRESLDYLKRNRDGGPIYDAPDAHEGLTGCSVSMVQSAPVPPEIRAGLTLIISPKGSGKTEGLKRLIAGSTSALLIGHRRTLIRQSAERLGLGCYLDRDEWKSNEEKWEKMSSYAVCLDSLGHIHPGSPYDTVIFDESEQVLAHLLSDTLNRRDGPG